jgi:hypothetical protein
MLDLTDWAVGGYAYWEKRVPCERAKGILRPEQTAYYRRTAGREVSQQRVIGDGDSQDRVSQATGAARFVT